MSLGERRLKSHIGVSVLTAIAVSSALAGCTAGGGGKSGKSSVSFAPGGQASSTGVSASGTTVSTVTTSTPTTPSAAPLNRAILTGPASVHRGRCNPYTLQITDAGGSPAPVAADLAVQLTGAGAQGAFYSDEDCTELLTSATVPAGASAPAEGTLYFKNTQAGAYSLAVGAAGPGIIDSSTLAVSVTVAPATQLHWAGAGSGTTVSCVELNVLLHDQYGEPATLADPLSVDLTDGTAPGEYYSDSACTQLVSAAMIAAGQSSTITHYRQASAGSATLRAASGALTASDHPLAIAAAPPSQLVMSGGASMTTVSCSPFSIVAKDAMGFVANASGNLNIALTSSLGSFYLGSACATAITSTQIVSGTNSVTVYFASLDTGIASLGAASAGLTAGSRSVTVNEAPADILVLSGPGNITSVACSPYVISSQDANHQTRNVSSTLAVSLTSSDPAGSFYSNSSCATATSSTTLASGTSSRTVYYRKTTAGPTNLQADATDFSPGQLSVTATQGPAATLSISAAPADPIDVTACTPFSVTLQDAYGNVANTTSAIAISLSGAGTSGAFYSNVTCTSSAISSVSIPASSASANFYYKKTAPGSTTLLASRSGMTTAQRAVSIVAAGPSSVVFTSATTATARNVCRAYTIQLRDVANNVVTTPAPVIFTLGGAADGAFYSNSTCATAAATATVATNQNAVTFYYKKPTAGTATVSVATDGYVTRTQAVVFSSATPDRLAFATAPSPIAKTTCNSFRVNSRDEQNLDANVTALTPLTITGLGADGQIFSNSTCTTALASPAIAANANSLTFYYRKATAGSVTLSAAATGLTTATKATVVSSGDVTNVAWTAGASSIRISTCSSFTISTRDEASLVRPVTAATLVTLSGAGTGGEFHNNSTCTAAITEFTLAAGSSAKTLYYIRPNTGAVTLRADSTGLTSGTRAVTVTVGTPTKMGISAGSAQLVAGSCSPYTLSFYDASNNVVAVAANTTVTLGSTIPDLEIFTDENCTSEAPTVFVPSGQSSQLLYFKSATAGESGNFSATASGLTAASFAIQTTP